MFSILIIVLLFLQYTSCVQSLDDDDDKVFQKNIYYPVQSVYQFPRQHVLKLYKRIINGEIPPVRHYDDNINTPIENIKDFVHGRYKNRRKKQVDNNIFRIIKKRWVDVDEDVPDSKTENKDNKEKEKKGSFTPASEYETLTKLVGEFDKGIPNKVRQVNDISNLKSEEEALMKQQSSFDTPSSSPQFSSTERYFASPTQQILYRQNNAERSLNVPGVQINDNAYAPSSEGTYIPIAKAGSPAVYRLASENNYVHAGPVTEEGLISVDKSGSPVYFTEGKSSGYMNAPVEEGDYFTVPKENPVEYTRDENAETRQNVFQPMNVNEVPQTGNVPAIKLPLTKEERESVKRAQDEYLQKLHMPHPNEDNTMGYNAVELPNEGSISHKVSTAPMPPMQPMLAAPKPPEPASNPLETISAHVHHRPRLIILRAPRRHHHHRHLHNREEIEESEQSEFGEGAVCHPTDCRNGGTCNVVDGATRCSCTKGFRGPTCEDLSLCIPNPCKHGGTCTETESGYVCTCPPITIGEHCETLSHCHPNPCRNNGFCYERGGSFECSCTYGFKGTTCALSSFCQPTNPCLNNGICSEDDTSYKCSCARGFKGTNCEVKRTTCSQSTCQNGGTCTDEGGQIHCGCPEEYKGRFCEEKVFRPCAPTTCLFGGSCIEVSQYEYQCLCPPGRTGKRCSAILEDPCAHCHPNAKCIDTGCICRDGFTGNGAYCERVPNKCHPNPCENGGTCVDKYYYLDETVHNANMGSIADIQSEQVPSKVRYSQKYPFENSLSDAPTPISIKPEELDSDRENPNFYKGESLGVTLFRPNYRSASQEILFPKENIVKKDTLPRFNNVSEDNGPSMLLNSSHLLFKRNAENVKRFEIARNIFDDFIDEEKSSFNSKSIEIGGRRHLPFFIRYRRDVEAVPLGVDRNQLNYNGFACACPSGFKGDRCEAVEPCHPNPCRNGGKCTEFNNLPTCECPYPYTGLMCNATDSCQPENPCRNEGVCEDHSGTTVCSCKPRFRGQLCEVDKCNKCSTYADCNNSGVCKCKLGYIGNGFVCEFDVKGSTDPCHPNPCQHSGSCTRNTDRTSHCHCMAPYFGKYCEEKPPVFIPVPKIVASYDNDNNNREENVINNNYNNNNNNINNINENKYSKDMNTDGYKVVVEKNSDKRDNSNGSNDTFADTGTNQFHSDPYNGPDRVRPMENSVRQYCHPNPCLNDGICVNEGNTYGCTCQPQFLGAHCEEDKCLECHVQATCTDGICKCREGYQGNGFSCKRNPCDGGCPRNSNCRNGACECKAGYLKDGDVCIKDHCGKKCPPNSACHHGVCVCEPGFYKDEAHCKRNLCDHKCPPNSECRRGECKCNPGYAKDVDDNCMISKCNHECPENSQCDASGVCFCHPGYFKDHDQCLKSACEQECPPHSRCDDGFCVCDRGFFKDGDRCKSTQSNDFPFPDNDIQPALAKPIKHLNENPRPLSHVKKYTPTAFFRVSLGTLGYNAKIGDASKTGVASKTEFPGPMVYPSPLVSLSYKDVHPVVDSKKHVKVHPVKYPSPEQFRYHAVPTKPTESPHITYPTPGILHGTTENHPSIVNRKVVRYPSPSLSPPHRFVELPSEIVPSRSNAFASLQKADTNSFGTAGPSLFNTLGNNKEVGSSVILPGNLGMSLVKAESTSPSLHSLMVQKQLNERIANKAEALKALGLPDNIVAALLNTVTKKITPVKGKEDLLISVYKNLGCWQDTDYWWDSNKRAIPSVEGNYPRLIGDYKYRKDPIGKCADTAKELGYQIFAIQNGGQCFTSSDALMNFRKYGRSNKCTNGLGGPLANDVYSIK